VGLTAKRQAFVDAYLKTWNASEAARVAGYSVPMQEGYRLLRIADIAEEVQRRVSERAMTADEVLVRLADIARGSMDDFVSFRPGVKLPLLDLEKAHAAGKFGLVKKLKYTSDGAIEFELYDAQAALVQLGKAHKLFVERSELTGKDGGDIAITVVDYRRGLAALAPEDGD
jgi:hypothetical protein